MWTSQPGQRGAGPAPTQRRPSPFHSPMAGKPRGVNRQREVSAGQRTGAWLDPRPSRLPREIGLVLGESSLHAYSPPNRQLLWLQWICTSRFREPSRPFLRGQPLASGQPPSAAHNCAAASNSAIGLGLTPATEDEAAAEPTYAASRRSSRTRRAPATWRRHA